MNQVNSRTGSALVVVVVVVVRRLAIRTSSGKHYGAESNKTRMESQSFAQWLASQRLVTAQRDRVETSSNCVPSAKQKCAI